MLRYNKIMEKLDLEIKSKTIQVQTQIHYFDYYFSVYILQLLLRYSDNCSLSL